MVYFDWEKSFFERKDGGAAMPRRKTAARIRSLLEALQSYRPERIYLFGSVARGEDDELSDIDVVVIKRTALPFFDRLREVARLLPAEIGGVDILVYTPEEFAAMQQGGNAFAQMLAEEGRLIYDRHAQGGG